MRFLDIMLLVLGIIGVSLIVLSIWFAFSVRATCGGDIILKFNILTFLTGLSYIVFIIIILNLTKKKR
jgi:hypothetical protein